MKKKVKRNPNDATFRNINAIKKRLKAVENDVKFLAGLVGSLLAKKVNKKG